nr:stage II sporulation protein M [Vagococcus teuberi]
MLVGFITFMIHPDLKSIIESTPTLTSTPNKLVKLMQYIINNGLKVPFSMLVLALIPVPYIYFFNIFLSATLGGVVFGAVLSYSISTGLNLIVASIPHSIIELTAFCIWASSLYYLNLWIRNKLHKRAINTTFWFELKRCVLHYIRYVLPLIIIAACLETFLTDKILNLLN